MTFAATEAYGLATLAGTLFLASTALLWRQLTRQDKRVRKAEAENGWCQWTRDSAFDVMRRYGIPIPQELYGPPPEDWLKRYRV